MTVSIEPPELTGSASSWQQANTWVASARGLVASRSVSTVSPVKVIPSLDDVVAP
jgi:hypothetical protein